MANIPPAIDMDWVRLMYCKQRRNQVNRTRILCVWQLPSARWNAIRVRRCGEPGD